MQNPDRNTAKYRARFQSRTIQTTLGKHRLLLLLRTFHPSNKIYERIDLFFLQLVGKSRHVASLVSSIHDGVEDALVANFCLPLCVREVAGVTKLAFRGLRPPIVAMTGHAMASIHLRCLARIGFRRMRRKRRQADQDNNRGYANTHRSIIQKAKVFGQNTGLSKIYRFEVESIRNAK